jgi:hypothetical protein
MAHDPFGNLFLVCRGPGCAIAFFSAVGSDPARVLGRGTCLVAWPGEF